MLHQRCLSSQNFKRLVDMGADINALDPDGLTTLAIAQSDENTLKVWDLLKHGAQQ